MKCPREGTTLVFVDDGRHLRDRCPECEGVLLDREELAAALGKGQGRKVALAADKVASLPEGKLACPRDGTAMRRLDHQQVELDLCPACGSLWLDRGELEKIRGLKGAGAGAGRKAALAGAAAVAAAGAAAATAGSPDRQGIVSGLAEAAGEVAAEGAIDVVFEFAIDAVGTLVSGIFS